MHFSIENFHVGTREFPKGYEEVVHIPSFSRYYADKTRAPGGAGGGQLISERFQQTPMGQLNNIGTKSNSPLTLGNIKVLRFLQILINIKKFKE